MVNSLPRECWCSFNIDPWAAKHLVRGNLNSNTSEIISSCTQLGTVCRTMWPGTELWSWGVPRLAFRVSNRRCWRRSSQWGPCCLKPWRESTWHRTCRMGHGSAFWTRQKTDWRGNTDSNTVVFHPIRDQTPKRQKKMLIQQSTFVELHVNLRIFQHRMSLILVIIPRRQLLFFCDRPKKLL